MQTLRVLARGKILVLDRRYAQDTGHRRYIGRDTVADHDYSKIELLVELHGGHFQANNFLEPGDKAVPHTAYPPKIDPTVLVADSWLVRSIQDQELWPADEATAKYCDVVFDPKFGGEYSSKASKSAASKVGE